MKLADLVDRAPAPAPWSEGEKIPWNEPGFSRRMLEEHLSQAHDAASRRTATIASQVAWIHEELLEGRPTRILDLGCGPGLYANRLGELGHEVLGIDFSPASIEHARRESGRRRGDVEFVEGDIREVELPGPFGLAMLLFGEANAFRREDLESILSRTRASLAAGGRILLEPHTEEAVRRIGSAPPSWCTARSGLFGDEPHLCLRESFWDEEHAAATQRWHVVHLATGETTSHAASMQAYSDDEYRALLERCGLGDVEHLPGLGDHVHEGLFALVARAEP